MRVFIESPYAGDVAANIKYARACLADSLRKGEAPFASHLLYTQDGVLDDTKPEERSLGIAAGQEFLACCDLSAVYIDRGITDGMRLGIEAAQKLGITIEYRSLEPTVRA